jgi:hypothetical protein
LDFSLADIVLNAKSFELVDINLPKYIVTVPKKKRRINVLMKIVEPPTKKKAVQSITMYRHSLNKAAESPRSPTVAALTPSLTAKLKLVESDEFDFMERNLYEIFLAIDSCIFDNDLKFNEDMNAVPIDLNKSKIHPDSSKLLKTKSGAILLIVINIVDEVGPVPLTKLRTSKLTPISSINESSKLDRANSASCPFRRFEIDFMIHRATFI